MMLIGKIDHSYTIVINLLRGKIIDLVHQAARFFQPHQIMCLVEPLSTRPNYYLRSYSTAMDIVQTSQSDNLKIMLDSLHLQRLHGNLTERVKVIRKFSNDEKRLSKINFSRS